MVAVGHEEPVATVLPDPLASPATSRVAVGAAVAGDTMVADATKIASPIVASIEMRSVSIRLMVLSLPDRVPERSIGNRGGERHRGELGTNSPGTSTPQVLLSQRQHSTRRRSTQLARTPA